jgi:hypothetical protein
LEVELVVTSGDGTRTDTLRATTANEGRATFSGLESWVGGTAIAKVSFSAGADGAVAGAASAGASEAGTSATSSSLPIPITADGGSRVMLVRGAGEPDPSKVPPGMGGAPGAASADGAGHGGQGAMPLPGRPFPLDNRPAGQIVIGVLDLVEKQPVAGAKVTLEIRDPAAASDAAPRVESGVSDEQGRFIVEGMTGEGVPKGARFTVVAEVAPGEIERSETFELGEKAVAVVMTRGASTAAAQDTTPAMPPRRPPLPPPRPARDVPVGSVRVTVVDAASQPVPAQKVEVVRRDITGTDRTWSAVTGDDGVAIVQEVDVTAGDAFFFVGAMHGGAPFQTGFFNLPDNTGAAVNLRVFPTTDDRTRVRSAAQLQIIPRENDLAEVVLSYEVFVDGDAAFWPAGGMRLWPSEGARSVEVLPGAEGLLDVPEGAPFANLTNPLPPGEILSLSMAWMVPHDGEARVRWTSPFPLLQGAIALSPELRLLEGASGAPQQPPHEDGEPLNVWLFEGPPFAEGPCQALAKVQAGLRCPTLLQRAGGATVVVGVDGLPTRDRWAQWAAIGIGAVVALAAGLVLAIRPRVSVRDALLRRRALLERALARAPAGSGDAAELVSLIARVDEKLAALDFVRPTDDPSVRAGQRRAGGDRG